MMTLTDQEWSEHIAMLKESKTAGKDSMFILREISANAWDIGVVSGVLQGVELTPALLPKQKEAIADARKALKRIEERNKRIGGCVEGGNKP